MKRSLNVTDHAVLRHIERVLGYDVAAIRQDIRDRVAVAEDHPAATSVLADGYRYVIEGDNVVTVLHKSARATRMSDRGGQLR